MKKYIEEVLVEMHKTATVDKYGLIHRSKFSPSLFKDKKEEVESFCEENRNILLFSTYSGSFGTYRAFTILDEGIKIACSIALTSHNKNFDRVMTSWY